MELSAVILLTFNFLYIGATPAFFFRKDGSFNLMWFITGLPLFLWPVSLFGVYWGYLEPNLSLDSEMYASMKTLGVLLSCGSIALISLTMGTHRIPLALWHQDNDAPRTIVTWGAYRFIRHPFYTSFIIAHTAALMIAPHWFQLLLLTYQILILNHTAAREERNLSQSSFGAEYRDFITRTGRFFPKPNAAAFMETYLVWVTQYRHLVLGLLAGFTIFFSVFLVNIGINATPYFISPEHPVRVTESEIKSIFTNTEEQAFVALVDEKNGIFTTANLELVQKLTQQLERISFADDTDLERLRSIAGDDAEAQAIVATVAQNGIGLEDVEPLRQLVQHGKSAKTLTTQELEKIEDIIVRARPVKRVRSLFTVEDIRVDGDDLAIDSLIEQIPSDNAGLQALQQHIMANPLLVGVIVSQDGKATNMQVELNIAEDDSPNMQAVYAAIEKLLAETGGDAQLHFSGPPMVTAQIAQIIQQDNMLFFPLVSTVICLILFISFRRLQAVVLTMTVCTLSTLWTMGFMAMFGIDVNIVTASLPVFLMTIAVADSIHYLTEYYGLLNTHDRVEAVKVALRHLMKPMFMTSLTDFFGFIALAYTSLVFVREFGIFIAAGAVFAFIISVTLLPAILPLLKQPANASENKQSPLMNPVNRGFGKLYLTLGRAPLLVLAATAAIAAFTTYLSSEVRVDNHNIVQFSEDTRIRQDDAILNRHFGGTVPINVWFSAADERRFTQPDVIIAMDQIAQRFEQHDIIGYVGSPSNLVKRIHQLLNNTDYALPADMSPELIAQYFLLYENGNGQEIRDSLDENYKNARLVALSHTDQSSKVRAVLQDVEAYAKTVLPADVKMQVAGFGQIMVTSTDEIVNGQISSLTIATLLIAGVMILLFRSWWTGVLSVIPLALTILINFGTMNGLGLDIDIGTALITGIVFGIGVDYAIHLLSYIKHATREGKPLAQAIEAAIEHASWPIMVNSVCLALGFSVLVASHYGSTGRLGLLIAATMIVCALLTLIVLPVLVKLFKPKALQN